MVREVDTKTLYSSLFLNTKARKGGFRSKHLEDFFSPIIIGVWLIPWNNKNKFERATCFSNSFSESSFPTSIVYWQKSLITFIFWPFIHLPFEFICTSPVNPCDTDQSNRYLLCKSKPPQSSLQLYRTTLFICLQTTGKHNEKMQVWIIDSGD